MKRAVEFDAEIGADGKIDVPPDVLASVGRGSRVRVRLVSAALASALGARGVAAGEVERIAGLQKETHEQVLAFLLSEGALARSGRNRRRRHGRAGER